MTILVSDLALLGLFARAFNGDVPKMLRFFNASVPGHREKWHRVSGGKNDYQELTLAKALSGLSMTPKTWDKFVEQPRKNIEFREFPTEEQKKEWNAFQYVIQPLESEGQFDGWFPLGSPSLVGGSSGSGKTTFMLDLCVKQAAGDSFYSHRTCGRHYLVLMLDRGRESHERTMRRLGFSEEQVPIKFLRASVDGEASQQIIDMIEQTTPLPELVFIEGMDMLVSDPNALEVVMPFMHEMQQIATHYHIAIVGSVGAPKTKPKDGYAAKRDTIFGSAVWSRMSETIVTLQFPLGDDTADHRIVSILPRNAKAEKFDTVFQHGRLAETTFVEEPEEKHPGGRPDDESQKARVFLETRLQNKPEGVARRVLVKEAKDLGIDDNRLDDAAYRSLKVEKRWVGGHLVWILPPICATKENIAQNIEVSVCPELVLGFDIK